MIDLGGNDVLPLVTIEGGDAFETQVVGLGSSTGEHDLFRVGTNQISDLLAGILASLLGFPSETVGS